MTSFHSWRVENSGESVALRNPVSNCRYPTGVSVAGLLTVGRAGLAAGSSICGCPDCAVLGGTDTPNIRSRHRADFNGFPHHDEAGSRHVNPSFGWIEFSNGV